MLSIILGAYSCAAASKKDLNKKKDNSLVKMSDEEMMRILFSKDNYIYDPSKTVDPFVPFTVKIKQEEHKKLSPLEKLSLNEIKLVGISKVHGKYIALIEDSTGRGYFIEVGVHVGDGKVVKITENEVHIVQHIRNFMGKITSNEIILKLRPAED